MTYRYKLTAGTATVGDVEPTPIGPIATVKAIIANLDPGFVDLDGDTYAPGAFAGARNLLISSWNHSATKSPTGGSPPVGVGRIDEIDGKAVFTGHLWTSTEAGRHVHQVLRHLGPAGQWSYTYRALDEGPVTIAGMRANQLRKLHVTEVSPVHRGAGGPGAHTLEVGDMTAGATDEALRELVRSIAIGLDQDLRRELAGIAEGIN